MNIETLTDILEKYLDNCDTVEKVNEFREVLENVEACCDDQEQEIEEEFCDSQTEDHSDNDDLGENDRDD